MYHPKYPTLQAIYEKVNVDFPHRHTDKGWGAYGPQPGGPGHTYAQFYDLLFGQYRDHSIKMLEVGVNRGGSLVMWSNFFHHPNSQIFGIDIQKSFADFTEEKIKAFVFDAGDPTKILETFGDPENRGTTFDIIIDDGAHEKESQIKVFNVLKNRVRPGGLYVIEDIQDVNSNLEYLLERLSPTPTVIDRRWINGQLDDVLLVMRF